MAETSNQHSNFSSKFGAGYITAAQYLAELICSRLANKEGKTLGQRFWLQPFWKREFKKQILAANSLLKTYSAKAIIKVLTENPGVWSLHAKWLDPRFQQAQQELEAAIAVKAQNELVSPPKAVLPPSETAKISETRPAFRKESVLDKLKGLE